jgi:hypothetical protein
MFLVFIPCCSRVRAATTSGGGGGEGVCSMFSSFSSLRDSGGDASRDAERIGIRTGDAERAWLIGPRTRGDSGAAAKVQAGEASGDVVGDPAGSTSGSGLTDSAAESAPA